MTRHEATFDIETKSDAHIVQQLADQLHNTMREELMSSNSRGTDPESTLREFADLQEATRESAPGTFRVVYEPTDESFEE